MARLLASASYDMAPPVPVGSVLVQQGHTPDKKEPWWRYYNRSAKRTYLVIRRARSWDWYEYNGNAVLPCCR